MNPRKITFSRNLKLRPEQILRYIRAVAQPGFVVKIFLRRGYVRKNTWTPGQVSAAELPTGRKPGWQH